MPFYSYYCKKCNSETHKFQSMNELSENGPPLCVCKETLRRIFKPLQVINSFKPYYDIGLNKMISSKREVKEIENREGKVWGDDKELRQESEKNRKQNQKNLDDSFTKKTIPKVLSILGK